MNTIPARYCESVFAYRRRPTHEVMVGSVGVGGTHPIRIQSMTIADTMDTDATVQEAAELARAGCEIVRITAPSIREAKNLEHIRDALRGMGIGVPLVADIHYTPNAALVAADFVEKVRINPGNYADKKKFEVRDYSDAEYEAELERIRERFSPLVLKCRENGTAMRIGVNHGSLSDRIMNRYGDTPEGMVQSALEFLHICEDHDYHAVVLSMKSSNAKVMIQAYRLLVARMYTLGMTYPLHLGVTEAGNGEDGRIKSAVGIGALLEDGIGDTIRVSLTEDAIYEVPVARALAEKYNRFHAEGAAMEWEEGPEREWLRAFPPDTMQRRPGYRVNVAGAPVGGGAPVRVITALETRKLPVVGQNGSERSPRPDWHLALNGARESFLPVLAAGAPAGDATLFEVNGQRRGATGERLRAALADARRGGSPLFLHFAAGDPSRTYAESHVDAVERMQHICESLDTWQVGFCIDIPASRIGGLTSVRRTLLELHTRQFDAPLLLGYRVQPGQKNWTLDAAATLGALLCDGFGDAVLVHGAVEPDAAARFAFTLLQATRARMSKTEFISCPSCGRTLFNLQKTTARIQSKTGHLKGVSIAVMGCIVNGPGEMADADFGYVGAGPKKVNLFVGKSCVERNIPEDEADDRLIDLIKRHGKWREPEPASAS